MCTKPPLGVIPYSLWLERYDDPTLEECLTRYMEVSRAVGRYLSAGKEPLREWLAELGSTPTQRPCR